MAGNLVQISLLGTRFSIQTDQDPKYVQHLLDDLAKRISHIQGSLKIEDPVRAALLAGLFLEDDLAQCRSSHPDGVLLEEVEKLHLSMIKSIDQTLSQ
jgi:cell division protein ZapA (FtsZ GTPase activity inhibitor)